MVCCYGSSSRLIHSLSVKLLDGGMFAGSTSWADATPLSKIIDTHLTPTTGSLLVAEPHRHQTSVDMVSSYGFNLHLIFSEVEHLSLCFISHLCFLFLCKWPVHIFLLIFLLDWLFLNNWCVQCSINAISLDFLYSYWFFKKTNLFERQGQRECACVQAGGGF